MNKKPLVIGVAGGTASGKTSICHIIMEQIGKGQCVLLQLDSFYKPLTEEENKNLQSYNFDHPNALDFDLVDKCLQRLVESKGTKVPLYDFKTNDRYGEKTVESASVVLFEGILTFYQEHIRDLMDLKIFVNTDDDVRLGRRLVRDIKERGRTIESVITQYNSNVKKSYDEFIKPTMKHADIIIPRGRENAVAIQCVVNDIKLRMRKMGIQPEGKWILNPVIGGNHYTSKSFTCLEAEIKDEGAINRIYEVTNKLLSNGEPSMKHVWLEYLAGKLLKLVAKEEKLLKRSFEIAKGWKKAKEGIEVEVVARCAVLSQEDVEEIEESLKEMKAVKKLVVICFYSNMEAAKKIKENERLKVYALICNQSTIELKGFLLNNHRNFSSPADEDYCNVFVEQLSTLPL
eukprot:TRINITY_DN2332_c0_g1_i10.p1 TRINITY_DN2332_c0_g1~~TRINITY_DN2332_c0_g1_i10.p1  ORF type:complete len:402 (+),score=116.74 TRINITY_DN2332_c0_g1_i10:162-1367(+)